jgi:riboflavin synthase
MFTGLIEETGRIIDIRNHDGKTRITVEGKRIPAELKLGDSVAVSGVCLTALDLKPTRFSADLAQETLQRTSLTQLTKGSSVNLELAARAEDRMGGHVVQGHVDGVGKLISLEKIPNAEDRRLAIEIPPGLESYAVPQGSITVEGISLTIASIAGNRVEIAIIPHTYEATNLHTLKPGSPLNVEVDVLAKYAEKAASVRAQGRHTLEELVRRGF